METRNLLSVAHSAAVNCTVYTEPGPGGSAYIGGSGSPLLFAFERKGEWLMMTRESELLTADMPPDPEETGPLLQMQPRIVLSYPPPGVLRIIAAEADPSVAGKDDKMMSVYREWWQEAHPFFLNGEGIYLQTGGYPLETDDEIINGDLVCFFFDGVSLFTEVFEKEGELFVTAGNG